MKTPSWFWLSLLLCVGCGVRGKHVDFARYDAKEDTFVHLHSWTNIPLEKPADLARFQSIWKQQDSIVILPYLVFGVPAIERKGSRDYQWIDLESSVEVQANTDPVIDFDSIRIVPGVVYQDDQERLGYYHTAVIPGGTMTAIVAAAFSALADAFVEDHLSPSGTVKGKTTWENFRQTMSFHLEEMAGVKDSPKPVDDDGSLPFDVSTYKLWRSAAAARSFKVTRTRDEFVVIVPMTLEDSQESVTTYQVYQRKLVQLAKDGGTVGPVMEGAESISMRAVDGPALEITIQFSKLAKVWNPLAKESLHEPLKVNAVDAKYRASVIAIQQHGIPIAPRKSIDDVVAEFSP